ncbi:MAG: SGNH/GDSL hydrolase family protein, partial [Planctomycetota bacterium]
MQSPAKRRPRKPASWRARLLLLVAGLCLGVLLAECLLAASGIVSLSSYEQDRVCGARLKPNFAGWQTQEGRVFVRTNSDGFRDREHPRAKPANTIRIAVLGDSYCEAMQVEQGQTFWSVMERDINQCLPAGSAAVEVINTGVAGYGTA